MAEENPHIEIKKISKPIENSREQYLFENENLIIGRPGFIFRSYPTLKERLQQSLQEQKEYNFNLSKMSRNTSLGKLVSKNILNNNINNAHSTINNSQLLKSKSQANILSQPILRFKNRTDLERICDTIQQYVKPSEQEKIKEIRARHVHSIDFPRGILYKGGFKDLKNLKKLQKKSISHNLNYQDDTKSFDVDNKNKPIIFFTRLQRLNVEAKKLRSNLHIKTHFKGVESVFINPKQIYDTVKKEENSNQKNIGNYAYNENYEKEEIEKRNEYKEDMYNLLKEEKEKENIINTKEFNNYLNNKFYYNDPVILNNIGNKQEEDKINQIKKMNYLKKIAFEDDNIKSSNRSNESGNINTDSSNDVNSKNKKNENYENEHQLRIGGKIFNMQNEMGLIAKEILNRCKFYTPKNEVNK